MQKINLIAQGVLELSHRENADNDNDNDNDTHPGWIIVRDGMYSVADKNEMVHVALPHAALWQERDGYKLMQFLHISTIRL